jgi:hypothetical protein
MATRRPIYRKQESRSISRIGFMLCLLLGGAVLLVPAGGDIMRALEVKVRDLVMNSTLVDLDSCVVTQAQALACTSGAVGVPLPVALRQMKDNEAEAAEQKAQRRKAEGVARELALEIQRLNAHKAQGAAPGNTAGDTTGDTTVRFFPALAGAVKPAARGGSDDPAAGPQPEAPAASSADGALAIPFMPPAEDN